MEAIAAAQVDGEVPSVSGCHGNRSHRSQHRVVASEWRESCWSCEMLTTSLTHLTLHFTQRQSVLSSSRGFKATCGNKHI